jgi:hypothetical protein
MRELTTHHVGAAVIPHIYVNDIESDVTRYRCCLNHSHVRTGTQVCMCGTRMCHVCTLQVMCSCELVLVGLVCIVVIGDYLTNQRDAQESAIMTAVCALRCAHSMCAHMQSAQGRDGFAAALRRAREAA